MTKSHDRTAQQERTRQAILDGARQLLSEGKTVTVTAAASRNGVSKATSYRYFSDASVLVSEAVIDVSVKPYEAVVADAPDLRGKLKAICLYFLDLSLMNEPGFRQFMAAAMTEWRAGSTATKRGGRRIKMFRQALAEHDTGLSREQCDTLVRALSASTGLEAMIALIDVAGATQQEARETVAFMVDAIVDRTFEKAD